MSNTPAARLARLKVAYPGWAIGRADGGTYVATPRIINGRAAITASTVDLFAQALYEAEEQSNRFGKTRAAR